MEREKHKEELAKKLQEKDPSVFLVKPEKSSKSCAWSADCFSLIFNNNVKENFVYCQICANLITYNSVHGTGSLLRHHCYKKFINAQKDENLVGKRLNFSSPSKTLKRPLVKSDTSPSPSDAYTDDAQKFQMKCRDNTKQKKDIEELISKGDPSIDMRPPANIKSEVWSTGNFKIVYQYGNKLDFVMCLFCRSLITYKSKTGTASLLRHSCMKKLNLSVKSELKLPCQEESLLQEIVTLPMCETDATDDTDATAASGDNVSFEHESEQEQYLSNEFPDEFKEEAFKLFQYLSYKDMQPTNLMQKKGLIGFSQYLINIGAEYGKINIETILEGRNGSNTSLGDNSINILQKMIKSKFDDNKMAFSCDCWPDPNRKLNFFTLYGHYISDIFELKKANLGTVSFTEEFASIDYKQLIISILENYFSNEADVEVFLSKTTTVIFDEVFDCLKPYPTINCACLTINRIVQQIIDECGFRDLIPNEILTMENWSHIWDYLEMMEAETAKSEIAINEFKRILDPFTKASKSLSSDSKPTINEVYIFRKKIEDHFKNAQFSSSKIREFALNLIREQFPMTNLHKIAVFLDPRFKSLKFMNHEDKLNVLSMINKMITSDDPDNNVITFNEDNDFKQHQSHNVTKTSTTATSDTADSSKYLIEYMDIVEERDETHDEVELYMNLKFNDIYSTNILEFWESRYDLPHLRQLAREILSIPATAMVSEKLFVDDASLLVKRRLNMEIDNVKQMMYIHENFEMLDVL